jgi:iron complex outermembrane recepter protein
MKSSYLLRRTAIATAAVALMGPLQAQTAPEAANPENIQRIVVQSALIGFRQTMANVKITAADLDNYPTGVSADKLLERISGIQMGSSNAFGGDGFESTINMRGFGKDSIGFSIDGIPNGRTTLGGGSVPTRYFDSSNLAGVDVSQSAGVIGSPSHQSLVGHVNYVTQDPDRLFSLKGEAAAGSAQSRRLFARVDTGELAPGLAGYLSASSQRWVVSYVDDPAGRNSRDHVDFKAVVKLDGGAVVKLRSGWNERKEQSGTNIVTLNQFNANPRQDGYSDSWASVPSRDRNFRGFKGNPRTDHLTHAEGAFPLQGGLKLDLKAYYHTQTGVGKESSLGNAGFPGLDGLATSIYFRANNYTMTRRGGLGELSGKANEWLEWRVGAWLERYNRAQLRSWHPVLNESVGPEFDPVPATTSEDKHWINSIRMAYLANRSSFLDGRLRLEYGLSYIHNRVDYNAPIQDSRTGRFGFVNEASVQSGPLPKLGALWAISDDTEVFAGLSRNAASVTDATLEGGAARSLATAATVGRMDISTAADAGIRFRSANQVVGVQAFAIRSRETVAADIVGTLQSENVDQGREIAGVEFTYSYRQGAWRLYTALTLQKHRYRLVDVDANGYPARGFIRNGAELVGIANGNVFAEATWRPLDGLKLALNSRYVSSRAGYYGNPRVAGSGVDERLPARTLFGLGVSYQWTHLKVGLNVENLTNEAHISGIAPELLTSPSTVGRYFIGAPRTVMLSFRAEL